MSPETRKEINTSLKNLIFFTHQNLLILTQIILTRMVRSKNSNQWATNLSKLLDSKMLKRVKTKGEAVQLLKVHMQNAENILRNLIKANSKKRFFAMINDWLNLITNIPNEKMRETLYNIEAFRADAIGVGHDIKHQQPGA